jgi:hypothetical protein
MNCKIQLEKVYMNKMRCYSAVLFKNICILSMFLASITMVNAQSIKVYETNNFGLKNTLPSIIIDENSSTGEFDVYSVDKFGLKHIVPDEIIKEDRYAGIWAVYRINDFGISDIVPKNIAEENLQDGSIRIYDINDFGLKDVSPSAIMEKDPDSREIKVYGVNDFGIKDPIPFEIIKNNGDNYAVYSTDSFGLLKTNPTRTIEIEENQTVFGVLLLPSLKQIKYDPGNSRIKFIRQIGDKTNSNEETKGWLKSKIGVKK